MSLIFSDYLDSTKLVTSYSNLYTDTTPEAIQVDSNVDYNYDSVDDFLAAIGVENLAVDVYDEYTLAEILGTINDKDGNCNFYLDSVELSYFMGNSSITSYTYIYKYNVISTSTTYADGVNKYYLNLKATAEAGDDSKEIEVNEDLSSIILNTSSNVSTETFNLRINFYDTTMSGTTEEDPEPQEIEVTESEYGSFPSGTSADYCVLLLHADEDYILTRGVSSTDLNNWAIDYLNDLNDYGLGDDDTAYEVASSYYGYDSEKQQYYVLVEKDSTDVELISEWEELFDSDYNLLNTAVTSNEKECYKVYVYGWCLLVGFDDATLISDLGGSTERKFYSYPNGYYVLVGDELRLFILDKIAKVDYELNSTTCTWYPITDPDNSQTLTLSPRTEYENGNYYFYIGKRITEANIFNFPIDHSDTSAIIQNASNLRCVLVSNSVLELETFAAIANPTNGLFLSDNLTAIGRYSFGAGGSSSVRIFSRVLEYIGELAFPSTANTRIFMCNEVDYSIVSDNSNSYIDLPPTVSYIGEYAFAGLSIGTLYASRCTSLSYIGVYAFAAVATMKYIYLAYSTLDINNTGKLIYLPDAIEYEIGTHSADSSLYASSGSNSDKSYSTERATFGTSLSGYKIIIS